MQTPLTGPPRAEQHTLTALLRVGEVAVAFREHVATGDLPGVWPLIDPTLRLAWARDWAQSHGAQLRRLCPKRLADRLSSLDGPAHPLWKHFAVDRLQQLRQVEAAGWRHPPYGSAAAGPGYRGALRPARPSRGLGCPGRSPYRTGGAALERCRVEDPRLRASQPSRAPVVRLNGPVERGVKQVRAPPRHGVSVIAIHTGAPLQGLRSG